MKRAESLSRRIILAYVAFAVGVSVIFAGIAALAVEGIEDRLVDDRLRVIADWASPRNAGHLPVEMPSGVSFHHGQDVPVSLRGLSPGVHKMEVDGVYLHVLAARDSLGDFVVVDHSTEYENIEIVVYAMFSGALIAVIGGSLALGRWVANRIVTPITELAEAVEQRKDDLPHLDREDELGVLARAFAGHTSELTRFLDRERFFTGDVSHELRTPLTVISGAAELLMERTHDEPALHAPSERIYRAAREASDVTAVLLRLARSPEVLEWSELSAASLAHAEVARYQGLVANRPLALCFGGGEDFKVQGPRELLMAAVGNLVRNACQYTQSGSVDVHLGPRSIIVEDTGPGLPSSALARMRGEPVADGETSAGAGLGLSLVQRICHYIGASIEIIERSGGGTCCILQFPDLTKI
ncbi:sensor histidine kinase [Pseudoduganella sp. RAF53_2]|uniref:sensor histidine kinase n=1 Tax=unclassified Pseudoduganella TaxID=2637179 RepID=UPI003F98D7E3